MYIQINISWGERNTAVTQFLVTLQERQKTFPFCSILLYATETYRIMIYKHRALDFRNLGPKFGPIPKAKKYVFFPILDEKFPNLAKCVWFRKISGVVIKYIKKTFKTKKVSIRFPIYIRKYLKFQLRTLNSVHLSSDTIVCNRNRVPAFI